MVFETPVGAQQEDRAEEDMYCRPYAESKHIIHDDTFEPVRGLVTGDYDNQERDPGQEPHFPDRNKAGSQGIGPI